MHSNFIDIFLQTYNHNTSHTIFQGYICDIAYNTIVMKTLYHFEHFWATYKNSVKFNLFK